VPEAPEAEGAILASPWLPTTTAKPMALNRIFTSAEFMQPTAGIGEPIRSVITQSAEAVIVAWHVNPGRRIAAHDHPHGQDTWTVLLGQVSTSSNKAESRKPSRRAVSSSLIPAACMAFSMAAKSGWSSFRLSHLQRRAMNSRKPSVLHPAKP
jgi:hypothetical protein